MTKQTMEIEITSNFDDVFLEFDKLISKVDELTTSLKKANKEFDLLASKKLG